MDNLTLNLKHSNVNLHGACLTEAAVENIEMLEPDMEEYLDKFAETGGYEIDEYVSALRQKVTFTLEETDSEEEPEEAVSEEELEETDNEEGGCKFVPHLALKEVRERKDAWEAANEVQKAKYNEQYETFKAAMEQAKDVISGKVLLALAPTDIPFFIQITDGRSYISEIIASIHVDNSRLENCPLRWSWEVSYNVATKKLKITTNSYSGMEVITKEQASFLRQSANALDILMDFDWENIFEEANFPKYEDYVTEKSSIGEKPEFATEEKEALAKSLVGTDALVWVHGAATNGKAWARIVKATDKQYQIGYIPDRYIKNGVLKRPAEEAHTYTALTRVSKDKLIESILYPLQVFSLSRNGLVTL